MKEEQRPTVSIIIPTLDERESIKGTLAAVARVRGWTEVIVVDGGSVDGTLEIARAHGAFVMGSGRGRGAQMHEGVRGARGEVLWFLHADTLPPADAVEQITDALARDPQTVGGNFDVCFDGGGRPSRFLTWLYPQLRRLGLCYGDSALFVRREVYERIGGFKPYPVFEDLDLLRGMWRAGRVAHLSATVVTSSRRFEGSSFAFSFARWAALQTLYWLGVSPHTLGRLYAPVRSRRTKS